MRPNPLKRKLRSGEPAVGVIMLSADPHVVGITAGAGFDYVLGDLEHTAMSLRELEGLVRAADAAGIVPATRVAGPDKADILAALETGVRALMVPAIETAEEARSVIDAARYAPVGRRGMYYIGYNSDYCGVAPTTYFRDCNEELLIMLQIETVRGVENAAEIARIPGVDCLFIGPADLTQSLGVSWEFEHPSVWDAIRRTFRAAREAGVAAGIMPTGLDYARRCHEEGARLLLWGPDLAMYQRAAREDAAAIAAVLPWKPGGGPTPSP